MIYQCILGQSFWLKWPEHNPRPRLELPCWYAAQYVLCKYSPVVMILFLFPVAVCSNYVSMPGVRMFSFSLLCS
ncbi:uncharacterized protein BO95DRAFT_240833 [Aspergillus brunneoviolaceus CBS 621.78]|uniref:Uncharacterized protein n=1 Tax=Aspergillus brunneoviolaceus CBS 621.78 TaxID=1450534 RepID=A0ACD1FZC2_9EURO|nr:hypothetical protein BO95DRAFT_240833 [Aspergillus brunneoviolaceus CBS 621.78]RAH42288.1 hypothetical protein BO95DRAFT_240833 [Aspergillus brunneoviolaceus CBS 621.78]